ncbi:MAG: amino acid ABC transporter ATP-binding protein [Clostridiales bacterium]|nr:amino acid ABC transporter ATP-binding protein [Clostridiales bacterium]
MAFLEIKGFQKSFGDINVLKGVDVSLEKGEVLSVIGSSGSGKTTLLRCINFLEAVDNGVMVLDGETLISSEGGKKENERAIRKKMLNFGLVFQSFNLFPQYTVIKNITLAPTLLLKENIKAFEKELKGDKTLTSRERRIRVSEFKANQRGKIEENAIELLRAVGLEDKAEAYPCQLSGGQCQRVAIARALALNPKVLCFDEPTSALDPELTGEVLKVIRSLKGKDRTMIIVTHEMEFARNVSDKIIFMADGVVEAQGTPDEIFSQVSSERLTHFLSNISGREGV